MSDADRCIAKAPKAMKYVMIALTLGMLLVVVWGCRPEESQMTVDRVNATGAHAAIDGRRVYLTRCSSCHRALPVHDYTKQQWEDVLPEMIREAHLNAAEASAVQRYIRDTLTQYAPVK